MTTLPPSDFAYDFTKELRAKLVAKGLQFNPAMFAPGATRPKPGHTSAAQPTAAAAVSEPVPEGGDDGGSLFTPKPSASSSAAAAAVTPVVTISAPDAAPASSEPAASTPAPADDAGAGGLKGIAALRNRLSQGGFVPMMPGQRPVAPKKEVVQDDEVKGMCRLLIDACCSPSGRRERVLISSPSCCTAPAEPAKLDHATLSRPTVGAGRRRRPPTKTAPKGEFDAAPLTSEVCRSFGCLLYTSDAADE